MSGGNVGIDVLSLDSQCRAEPISRQFATRDKPPDLLLAQAQMAGGVFNGLEDVSSGWFPAAERALYFFIEIALLFAR